MGVPPRSAVPAALLLPFLALGAAATGGGAATAAAAPALVIAEAPATRALQVTLVPTPPPGAEALEVGNGRTPAAWEARDMAPAVPWRLPEGLEGTRVVSVRFLDAEGRPMGEPVRAAVVYDVTPPGPPRVRARQAEPVIVCRRGGPRVAGTRESRAPYDVAVDAGEPGASAQVSTMPRRPGPWRPAAAPARVGARPGGALWARAADRAGNVGAWRRVALPPVRRVVAAPARLPFTHGLDCPGPVPAALVAAVRRAWGGRSAPHRSRVRPPGSALAWTAYAGQGIALNWVHAGTDLNERLRRGRRAAYRAGVAETLAHSVVDRAPSGRRFRVNENLFRDPDQPSVSRWRDGMGTAVILALLAPAIPPEAPAHERRRAREAAAGYLATFSVDHRHGGVLWRDGGPGEWFLEYAHRTRARVLNGFMQAVVSLARFERQARRMARSDPAWEPLRAEARRRVLGGGAAVHRWLPAFDLGGGATRYALGGGAATPAYRRYHAELLRLLARVPYLPAAWRARYDLYRVRWGGGGAHELAGPPAPPPS